MPLPKDRDIPRLRPPPYYWAVIAASGSIGIVMDVYSGEAHRYRRQFYLEGAQILAAFGSAEEA